MAEEGLYRVRIGAYRIIYLIGDDARRVVIVKGDFREFVRAVSRLL